jgi:hypothetical protein
MLLNFLHCNYIQHLQWTASSWSPTLSHAQYVYILSSVHSRKKRSIAPLSIEHRMKYSGKVWSHLQHLHSHSSITLVHPAIGCQLFASHSRTLIFLRMSVYQGMRFPCSWESLPLKPRRRSEMDDLTSKHNTRDFGGL